MEQRIIDAVLERIVIQFEVVAYDCSGYGENCSKTFTDKDEAIKYAKSLEKRFNPHVNERIIVNSITTPILF